MPECSLVVALVGSSSGERAEARPLECGGGCMGARGGVPDHAPAGTFAGALSPRMAPLGVDCRDPAAECVCGVPLAGTGYAYAVMGGGDSSSASVRSGLRWAARGDRDARGDEFAEVVEIDSSAAAAAAGDAADCATGVCCCMGASMTMESRPLSRSREADGDARADSAGDERGWEGGGSRLPGEPRGERGGRRCCCCCCCCCCWDCSVCVVCAAAALSASAWLGAAAAGLGDCGRDRLGERGERDDMERDHATVRSVRIESSRIVSQRRTTCGRREERSREGRRSQWSVRVHMQFVGRRIRPPHADSYKDGVCECAVVLSMCLFLLFRTRIHSNRVWRPFVFRLFALAFWRS